eukprot:4685172-Pleurochrysis_carterae.AAC.1
MPYAAPPAHAPPEPPFVSAAPLPGQSLLDWIFPLPMPVFPTTHVPPTCPTTWASSIFPPEPVPRQSLLNWMFPLPGPPASSVPCPSPAGSAPPVPSILSAPPALPAPPAPPSAACTFSAACAICAVCAACAACNSCAVYAACAAWAACAVQVCALCTACTICAICVTGLVRPPPSCPSLTPLLDLYPYGRCSLSAAIPYCLGWHCSLPP